MAVFVLVHGSWHGAWCWSKVAPLLAGRGHQVLTPDLPAHGADRTPPAGITLHDYAVRVAETIAGQAEPVVLVGHSLAGLVLSTVAEHHPDQIASLVYLAAHLLPNGDSMPEALARVAARSLVLENVSPNADGITLDVNLDQIKTLFYADCDDEDVARARRLLRPEPIGPRCERVRISDANWGRVPRFYIECLQDNVLAPAYQRALYSALPCARVYSMNTSHSPFFSAPSELASILDELSGVAG